MPRPPPGPFARVLLLSAGLIVPSCGGDEPPDATQPGAFAIQVATTTPMATAPARSAPVETADVTLLGVDGRARPVVVADGAEVYVLSGDTLERRRLFAGPGDPIFLGRVHAVRPRAGGGAWLAADAGLFTVDETYVLPVSAEVGPLVDVREVSSGPLAGIWLVTPTALLLSLTDEVARFEIPELLGPQSAFAVDGGGRRALVIAGPEVLLLEPNGLDLDVFGLPFDPGAPRAVAATASTLWLAADEGLFALEASDPRSRWRRVDLAGAGPVRAVALDADASEVYARDAEGRVLTIGSAGETPTAEVLETVTADVVAADGRGGVWIVRDGGTQGRVVEGRRLDAAPRFERDVRPFIEASCAGCHGAPGADFRDYDTFAPRAEAALVRIRSGDMPRCEDDRRCPEDQRLGPADYAILERWIEEGLLR